MKIVHHNGKIQAKKLELNVVEQCNLRCVECSHLSPYISPRALEVDAVERDLAALGAVFHCVNFRFVGGEPLLHRDLIDLMRAVRESGIADRLVVVSNGALINKMPDAFFQSLDTLEISWYPNTPTDRRKIDYAGSQCAKFGKRFDLDDKPVFRKMQVDRPNDEPDLVRKIYRTCRIAHVAACHSIHDGYYYKCSRPIFSGRYLALKEISAADLARADGVSLHAPDLLERLTRYIESEQPLESCRFCLGTVGKYVAHRQMTVEEVRSKERDPRPAVDYIDWKLLRFGLASRRVLDFVENRLPAPFFKRKAERLLRKLRPRRAVMDGR